MKLKKYASAEEAIAALNKRGFDRFFQFKGKELQDSTHERTYSPTDLVMVEHHRFHHPKDWQSTLIIIALEDLMGNKGLVISSFGQPQYMKLINFIDQVKMKSSVGT